jgi:chromosomal replication initiation ATPase DnaA
MEFSSAQELQAHYARVRGRINNPPPKQAVDKSKDPQPKQPNWKDFQKLSTTINFKALFTPTGIVREGPRKPMIADILRWACKRFGLDRSDITSPRRHPHIIDGRHAVWVVARAVTTYSLPDIGRHTGHFDHSTVLHAIKHRVPKDKQLELVADFREWWSKQ